MAEAGPSGRTILLRWGPHTLRTAGKEFPPEGTTQGWAILPTIVLLSRKDKPWRSHLENPVPAVDEVTELGAEAVVWMRPDGLPDQRLHMRLPTRVVRRDGLVRRAEVTVCLRAADIVLLQANDAGGIDQITRFLQAHARKS